MIDKKHSKLIFLLATFTSPTVFMSPVNFSIYEGLLLFSLLIFAFTKESIVLPDKSVLLFLFLILVGYSFSIINAPQPLEALKFPLQFLFIILVQSVLVYTLIESKKDVYNHVFALTLSGIIVVGVASFTIFTTQWEIGQRLETTFGINELAVVCMMLFITTLFYFFTSIQNFQNKNVNRTAFVISVGIIGISLFLISLLTLSRRIIPAYGFAFVLLISTNFLTDYRLKGLLVRFSVVGLFGIVTVVLIFTDGLIPNEIFLRVIETFEGDRGIDRFELWLSGIVTPFSLFPLGTGFNNFQSVSTEIQGRTVYDSPHNIILNPLAEGGVFAGIGIAGLILIICMRFLPKLLDGHFDPLLMSFPVATICFFISHIFGTLPTIRFYWLYVIFTLLIVSSNLPKTPSKKES